MRGDRGMQKIRSEVYDKDSGVEFPQPEPVERAPVIPNEDGFAKLSDAEREQVIAPLVDMGVRYKRAFGGWRLLAPVIASEDQGVGLWSGAALMCRTAEDRRGTQFCTIMSVVAPSVRDAVVKALR